MLTVEHIFVDCQFYHRPRRKYNMHNKCIAEILDDGCNVSNIMSFLKDVDLFDKI